MASLGSIFTGVQGADVPAPPPSPQYQPSAIETQIEQRQLDLMNPACPPRRCPPRRYLVRRRGGVTIEHPTLLGAMKAARALVQAGHRGVAVVDCRASVTWHGKANGSGGGRRR